MTTFKTGIVVNVEGYKIATVGYDKTTDELYMYELKDNEILVKDTTNFGGLIKPKWDGLSSKWIETATQEEIDEYNKPVKPPLSQMELVEAKLKASTGRQDFIEELIAEIAMKVYE